MRSAPCGQSEVQRRSVSGCDQMAFSVSRLFVGRPVANWEAEDRKLNVFTGLPAMGLDGLGSAAYGPEAALSSQSPGPQGWAPLA